MASAMSSLQSDECPFCLELLINPRVLDCQHTFCLGCLENLESNNTITCPQCRFTTDISIKKLSPEGELREPKTQLFRPIYDTIELSHVISSLKNDKCAYTVYHGTGNIKAPVEMYPLRLRPPLWNFPPDEIGINPSLAIDTKRGLILVMTRSSVRLYNKKWRHTETINCQKFQFLQDIAYQAHNDRYVVGDCQDHCLYYIDPDNHEVVQTVQAKEARLTKSKGRNFFMAVSDAGDNTILATVDSEEGMVNLYDGGGEHYGFEYGQFNRPNGICFDSQGRLIVSEMDKQRLVRVYPDKVKERIRWQDLGGTERFGLGHPRLVDIFKDQHGIEKAVVAFYSDPKKGPFHVTVVDGLD